MKVKLVWARDKKNYNLELLAVFDISSTKESIQEYLDDKEWFEDYINKLTITDEVVRR